MKLENCGRGLDKIILTLLLLYRIGREDSLTCDAGLKCFGDARPFQLLRCDLGAANDDCPVCSLCPPFSTAVGTGTRVGTAPAVGTSLAAPSETLLHSFGAACLTAKGLAFKRDPARALSEVLPSFLLLPSGIPQCVSHIKYQII